MTKLDFLKGRTIEDAVATENATYPGYYTEITLKLDNGTYACLQADYDGEIVINIKVDE